MNKSTIYFILLSIAILVLVNGCGPKNANESCIENSNCISNRCIEGKCDYSNLEETCYSDIQCREGMCINSYCSISEKGNNCIVSKQNACPADTVCYSKEGSSNGICIKNDSMCKLYSDYFGVYGAALFFVFLLIVIAVTFGIKGLFLLLGVNVITTPKGYTFTFLGVFIVAIIIFFKLWGYCL